MVEMGWFQFGFLDNFIFSLDFWLISPNGRNGLIPNSDFGHVEMVGMGWFPIQISDTFKSSPIYELSVQIDYPMRSLEKIRLLQ